MKYILFILAFCPLLAAAQQYSYNSIYSSKDATGFTTFVPSDQYKEKKGSIAFSARSLVIDGERFYLKKVKADNFIKTDKGHVKLIIENEQLTAVQVLRYNTLLTYQIDNSQPLETATVYHKQNNREEN